MTIKKVEVAYCTTSRYKMEEVAQICSEERLNVPSAPRIDGKLVGDVFDFKFYDVEIVEILETSIERMVRHKAKNAYREIQIPCIVEHAGLIFQDYADKNYPGGLTQPMWDALHSANFIKETNASGRKVIAQAVIGYCDGMKIETFTGETFGTIASHERGSRGFYWDLIFQPDNLDGTSGSSTYAEIVDAVGIGEKVKISQSTKALKKFLEFRLKEGDPPLFRFI